MTFDVSRSRSREVGHSGLRQTVRQGLGRQGDRNQPQPYPHLASDERRPTILRYGCAIGVIIFVLLLRMESSPFSSASRIRVHRSHTHISQIHELDNQKTVILNEAASTLFRSAVGKVPRHREGRHLACVCLPRLPEPLTKYPPSVPARKCDCTSKALNNSHGR